MGAIIGVVIGYALGTRAGAEGWEELKDAFKVIRSSEEARDLVGTGFSIARDLLGRASGILSGALAGSEDAGLGRAA